MTTSSQASFGSAAAVALGCGAGFAVASLTLAAHVVGAAGAVDAAVGLLVGSAAVALPLLAWPLLLVPAVRRRGRALAIVLLGAHVLLAMEVAPRARVAMQPTTVDGVSSPETQLRLDARTWTSDDFVTRWGIDSDMAKQEAKRRLLQLATVVFLLVPVATRRASTALPWLGLAVALLPPVLMLVAGASIPSLPLAAAAVAANEILLRARRASADRRSPGAGSRRLIAASIVAGLAVGAGVRAGPWLRDATRATAVAGVGERIASEVRTLDGRSVALQGVRREATLVVTWASWCAFCPAQLERMAALRDELGRDRVLLVALNMEGHEDVRAARDHRFDEATLVAVADPASPPRVDTASFPETWLLDADGRVRMHARGSGPQAAETIARAARRLVDPPP